MIRRSVCSLVVAVLCIGCTSRPGDPEGTLDRVRGGTLRVGVSVNEPWTDIGPEGPVGIEVELVKLIAAELDSEVRWFDASEQELFAALELGQLDLVIGGITSDSPWSAHAALTHPYQTTQVVVAVPEDEPIPDDIAGLEVAVEEGTEVAGVLEKEDAIPRYVTDVTRTEGAAAVDDWLLDDLGLRDTGVTLIESDHVMAARLGENGWLVELEAFLIENAEHVHRMLEEVEPDDVR